VRHLQERAQYLHQFVMHAALDAVDEQLWSTSAMHLGVVDRFNNLQASWLGCLAIIKKAFRPQGPANRDPDTVLQ
jgi:Sedlin, N-terminal conserved region